MREIYSIVQRRLLYLNRDPATLYLLVLKEPSFGRLAGGHLRSGRRRAAGVSWTAALIRSRGDVAAANTLGCQPTARRSGGMRASTWTAAPSRSCGEVATAHISSAIDYLYGM